MNSAISTQGFDQSVMPGIQYPNPQLYAASAPQWLDAMQQGQGIGGQLLGQRAQLQQFQDVQEMHPLQVAQAKLQLAQPVDIPLGTSIQANTRIGADGQPINGPDGNPKVDYQTVSHVRRVQRDPQTGQITSSNITIPGQMLATAEQQQVATGKWEMDKATAEYRSALAGEQAKLAEAKAEAARARTENAATLAKKEQDNAETQRQLAEIKQQHADTEQEWKKTQGHLNDLRGEYLQYRSKQGDLSWQDGTLPNGDATRVLWSKSEGKPVNTQGLDSSVLPIDTGMKPIPKGGTAKKGGLADLVAQNDALLGKGAAPTAVDLTKPLTPEQAKTLPPKTRFQGIDGVWRVTN